MSDVEIIMKRDCKSCRDLIGVASPTRLGFSVSCNVCKTFCYDTPGEEIPKAAASWQQWKREQAEERAARARRSKPSRTYNYNGYEMRSIAECRWAAFFDICEIKWQYEPISTGDYIPDFLLLGDDPTIVEIKGGATTIEQVERQTSYALDRLVGHWGGTVLCLGATPLLGLGGTSDRFVRVGKRYQWNEVGEFAEELQASAGWFSDTAIASTCIDHTPPHLGFCDEWGSFRMCPSGCYDGNQYEWPKADIEAKWAQATNTVRYVHGGAAA